jgi:hypothetical protein
VYSISEQGSYQYLCLLRQEEQILNYYKHTLLTQVIKILPDDAFFDSLKCPENAPFCVQWKKNLGENQPFCCLLYLATAMPLYSDNFNYRYFVYFL